MFPDRPPEAVPSPLMAVTRSLPLMLTISPVVSKSFPADDRSPAVPIEALPRALTCPLRLSVFVAAVPMLAAAACACVDREDTPAVAMPVAPGIPVASELMASLIAFWRGAKASFRRSFSISDETP